MTTILALAFLLQGGSDDLAKKLQNPVADLVSIPFQNNYDRGFGPRDDGERYTLNVQPVIPLSLSEDWNLISRTIVPFISQDDVIPGDDESGLGDILQSLFLSPREPGPGGLIWGAGPVALFPTATNERLGSEKWGFGPTAVALLQSGPWTAGLLANHLWGTLGDDRREDVNATYLQPFFGVLVGPGLTVGASMEATYDWHRDRWLIPLVANIGQVVPLGGRAVSFTLAAKWFVEDPDAGADWGIRFVITLLLPK